MPLFKTNVALSIKGSRVEKGTEIELSTEDVAHLDPADIELLGATVEAEPEQTAEVSLDAMTQAQLKARAKELGLAQGGSVADLRERITLHLNKPEPKLVDFVVTEEYLTAHPDLEVDGKKVEVGDTIQVPEEEITNTN